MKVPDAGTVTAFGLDIVPGTLQCASATPAPDLTVTKAHAANFVVGQHGIYTLTVSNAADLGPTSAPVTLTDTLPSGLTFVSGTAHRLDLWRGCPGGYLHQSRTILAGDQQRRQPDRACWRGGAPIGDQYRLRDNDRRLEPKQQL